MQVKSENRNVGLDLTRLWAMFGVVCLHVIIYAVHHGSAQGMNGLSWGEMVLNRMCGCAVDTFALLSGFFLAGRAYKTSRIVHICACVIFYGVMTSAVALALVPDFGWRDLSSSWAPFVSYWYVMAYIGVLLISPLLTRAVDMWKAAPVRGWLIFAIITLSSTFLKDDPIWQMNRGYSFLWLSVLFVLGGYLQVKFRDAASSFRTVGFFFGFVLLTIAMGTYAYYLGHYKPRSFAPGHTARTLLTAYVSPLLVLQAVLMFRVGVAFNATSRTVRWISRFGRYAFGAYLLHESPVFFKYAFEGKFVGLRGNVPMIVTVSLGVLAVGVLLDVVRERSFEWLRINKAIEGAGRLIDELLRRMEDRFCK